MNDKPARVFVLDDHPLVRDGLISLIGQRPDLIVCGESGDSADKVQKGMTEKRVGRRGWSAVEWPTVILIISCYAGWAFAGFVIWPIYPIVALALLGVVGATVYAGALLALFGKQWITSFGRSRT